MLVFRVMDMGDVPWKVIAEGVPNRNSVECRDRFNKRLRLSSRWKDKLSSDILAIHSRRGRPPRSKKAVVCDDAPEHKHDEGEIPLFFDPSEEPTDAFTFEDMLSLGALPHLSQPVPDAPPSPDALAALPVMTPVAEVAAAEATAAEVAPPRRALVPPMKVRIVPTDSIVKEYATNGNFRGNSGVVNPLMTFASTWRPHNFTAIPQSMHARFAGINAMINGPQPTKRQLSGRLAGRHRQTGVEFNPQLVVIA